MRSIQNYLATNPSSPLNLTWRENGLDGSILLSNLKYLKEQEEPVEAGRAGR
jgi:hypothetical protein